MGTKTVLDIESFAFFDNSRFMTSEKFKTRVASPSGVAKNGGTRGGILWWQIFLVQKISEDQKKVFAAKWVGFWSKSMWRPKQKISSPQN